MPFLAARRRREGKLWCKPITEDLDDVYALANEAAALRFGMIDLAREADDEARKEIPSVPDVSGHETDETPTVPGWVPKDRS